jgi:transcription antitermination factor NusG
MVCEHPWFALRVRSRHEKVVDTLLQGKRIETLLPVYRCRRVYNGRKHEVEMPLFPGYIFSSFDPERRLPILTTTGIVGVVGIGRIPQPLDESEVANIRRIVESGLESQPWPFLQVGQQVSMGEGPLTGVTGILQKHRKAHRLVVSMTLLQRSVAVEVETEWIRPMSLALPKYSLAPIGESNPRVM